MIKCDDGRVSVKGTRMNLIVEFTAIVKAFVFDEEKPIVSHDEFKDIIRLAALSDEDLEEEVRKAEMDVLQRLKELRDSL